jgi:hypothetical protein
MIGIMSLWLPIVLSAIIVFVASSIIHMVLKYHNSDYPQLSGEDGITDAIRSAGVLPGTYLFPWAPSPKEMGTPDMIAKYNKGPVGLMTIMPSGPPAMGKQLVQWFGFSLLVGVLVAYLTGRTMEGGAEYWAVFRIASTVAFLCYGFGTIMESIWWGRKWTSSAKNILDALVYGLLTGGSFAGFWPS